MSKHFAQRNQINTQFCTHLNSTKTKIAFRNTLWQLFSGNAESLTAGEAQARREEGSSFGTGRSSTETTCCTTGQQKKKRINNNEQLYLHFHMLCHAIDVSLHALKFFLPCQWTLIYMFRYFFLFWSICRVEKSGEKRIILQAVQASSSTGWRGGSEKRCTWRRRWIHGRPRREIRHFPEVRTGSWANETPILWS